MKKSLLIILLTLPILFGLKLRPDSFFSVNKYRIDQTGLVSQDFFTSIKKFLLEEFDNKKKASIIISDAKKRFPIIDKISIAYRPMGVYVKITPYKPLCCINNNLILAHNNELFFYDTFTEKAINSIAHVVIAPEYISSITSFVPPLLRELPPDFYETYNLELCNEHCVRLTHTQEKYFNIILSANQKNISSLLTYCDSVKKNIIERKDFDKGQNWTADVRFNDYIVVYKA